MLPTIKNWLGAALDVVLPRSCPVCGKATKVAHEAQDGKNVRKCKKCGAVLDGKAAAPKKATAKKATAKKSVKKADAELPVEEAPATEKPAPKKAVRKTTKKSAE